MKKFSINKVFKILKRLFVFLPLFVFRKYKRFAFGLTRFYRKVPALVWGSAAVFGIFALGVIAGIALNDGTESLAYKDLEEKQGKYEDLIRGYEELSGLYTVQGENINIITDTNMLTNYPNEYFEAYQSIGEVRDKIIFQEGRISEMRKEAGFFEGTDTQ